MNKEDETITTTTYNPHTEDKLELWVFPDSEFLPLDAEFSGEVEKRSKSGTSKIPCLKFLKEDKRYYLSLWSKPHIPLVLKSGDTCKIYINKDKKIEVLNLTN